MVRDVNEKVDESKEKERVIEEKTNTRIFRNVLVAILIMAYFVGVYLAYSFLDSNIFERVWQALTMVLLTISITVFEIAYKKDSGLLAINGIEALVIACHALAIPYVSTIAKWDIRWYVTISGYVFAIYYIFKSIIIYTKGKKEYLKSFSDIAEIVKEEKPTKKEAKKRKEEVE